MDLPPTLQRLQEADVGYIHDETGERFWWLLRSLPVLKYIGFETFTYPTSWRTLNTGGPNQSYTKQFDYLDYEYKVLGEVEGQPDEIGDLVVVTNEYYEAETQYSVSDLINRYSARSETLVIISNTKRFTPVGAQRPLYMEQFVEHVGPYQRALTSFEELYEAAGWGLPLVDTKNLFLQDNANIYKLVTGEQLTTMQELFNAVVDATYLPLYDVFTDIFGRENEFGTSPLDEDDVTGLQRWLRRRGELDRQTANKIAQTLNNAVIDDGSTFDPSYAARSPAMAEGHEAARSLNQHESSIHKRYWRWLQRARP
jgi:hypothetical protein